MREFESFMEFIKHPKFGETPITLYGNSVIYSKDHKDFEKVLQEARKHSENTTPHWNWCGYSCDVISSPDGSEYKILMFNSEPIEVARIFKMDET